MNVFIAVISGNTALLTPEESWHCAKVLRYKVGDAIRIIDGKGNSYEGRLTEVHEKRCAAQVVSGPFREQERKYRIHLAIAPTKHIDRTEWLVEKAVEAGVDAITFIRCTNSERTQVKTDRIQRVAESAVKQSMQASVPVIGGLINFREFINAKPAGNRLIAHCGEGEKINIKEIQFRNNSTCILIGPEGDFTDEEVQAAVENGFKAVSLGKTRLRTETAGLYAVFAASVLSA